MVVSLVRDFSRETAFELLRCAGLGAIRCATRLMGAAFAGSGVLPTSVVLQGFFLVTGVGLGRGGSSTMEEDRGSDSGRLKGKSRLGGIGRV